MRLWGHDPDYTEEIVEQETILAQLPPELVWTYDDGTTVPPWLPAAPDPSDPDPNADAARGSFRAWTFGIASNVLLEEFRRLSRTPRALRADIGGHPGDRTASLADELVAEMTSISERAARKETVLQLLQLAGDLDEDDRELLICRGLEAAPYEDVAQRLGISAEAARSRWRRLREQLRLAIEDAALLAEE